MFPFVALAVMRSSFVPLTRTYTSGTAAVETVPVGATAATFRVVGAGGSGGHDSVDIIGWIKF